MKNLETMKKAAANNMVTEGGTEMAKINTNIYTNENILRDETYPVPKCILDMFNTTDTKLIIRGIGEYESFREEIMESELQERLEEYKEEIPDEPFEDDGYIQWDNQVIFWFPADTHRIKEYLDCAWWCSELVLTAECQEFIDMALDQI